ncbi:hypothetical protein CDL15_Pgr008761 [Punica granatum]|uniref:Uncharacterized protein n=1 Tax=Punica granatum TaxID=22663 RepID=A0A218VX76_PUNGR|nr:hypothetical protein CDL15_Pgr008761 [Punica granatum]
MDEILETQSCFSSMEPPCIGAEQPEKDQHHRNAKRCLSSNFSEGLAFSSNRLGYLKWAGNLTVLDLSDLCLSGSTQDHPNAIHSLTAALIHLMIHWAEHHMNHGEDEVWEH